MGACREGFDIWHMMLSNTPWAKEWRRELLTKKCWEYLIFFYSVPFRRDTYTEIHYDLKDAAFGFLDFIGNASKAIFKLAVAWSMLILAPFFVGAGMVFRSIKKKKVA